MLKVNVYLDDEKKYELIGRVLEYNISECQPWLLIVPLMRVLLSPRKACFMWMLT
jgi:hypothetical protein